jgi:hypothetical protein
MMLGRFVRRAESECLAVEREVAEQEPVTDVEVTCYSFTSDQSHVEDGVESTGIVVEEMIFKFVFAFEIVAVVMVLSVAIIIASAAMSAVTAVPAAG